MKKFLSKTEANEKIEEFFENIKNKSPKEIKKIKRLAMAYNIKLGEKKKLFCKKCLIPYKSPSIRAKKGILRIICDNCNNISRYKII